MNRDTVKSSFIEKQTARHILQNHVNDTKYALAPATIKKKWTNKQKERLFLAKNKTTQIAKSNAPAIGVGVVATALFLCRKPIARMIKKRTSKS